MAATSGAGSPEEVVVKEETKKTLTDSEGESSSNPTTSQHGDGQLPPGEPASVPAEDAMETGDMPYFPAHPFSIFPPDAEPSAAITTETAPHQSAFMEQGTVLC